MSNIFCSVVVPMYNEEEITSKTYNHLKKVLDTLEKAYEIIFINDGSRDNTCTVIKKICETDKNVKLINFSRNFGHQIAITAGMNYASGDCVVVIDGDLQDPPEVILEMIKKWQQGYDVVYGKRLKREGETFFKKTSAKIFYRLLKSLTDFDIPVDTGDFRLIDRNVCSTLNDVNEQHRFVRGLVSWVGFKQTKVEFIRHERTAGETKYPLKKMIKLAIDGITSFSYKPLKLATYLGSFISFFSFLYLLIILLQKIIWPASTQPGWASILAVSLFFNGIILLMLGIIGAYIGRIYDEVKNRPLYIVKEAINFSNEEK